MWDCFGNRALTIKNEDSMKIKPDEKITYEQFTTDLKTEGKIASQRVRFVKQLTSQRKLKAEFELIGTDENLARKI